MFELVISSFDMMIDVIDFLLDLDNVLRHPKQKMGIVKFYITKK